MKAVIIKDGRELFNAHGDTLAKLIINLIEINEDRKCAIHTEKILKKHIEGVLR